MFMVEPALYEPSEVVEEKLVMVGAVVSGVAAIALGPGVTSSSRSAFTKKNNLFFIIF